MDHYAILMSGEIFTYDSKLNSVLAVTNNYSNVPQLKHQLFL